MNQHGFFFDAKRCIGCGSCVIACKEWHDSEPGDFIYWRRVITEESGQDRDLRLENRSLSCMHCRKPACLEVCLAGAILKRVEDGIVIVDRGKCVGCQECAAACPFGVPQYGADGLMQKCDFCIDDGRGAIPPECASACVGGALFAGPLDRLARIAPESRPTAISGPTEPSLLIPAR